MPRYNYHCSECKEVSVYRLSMNEEPVACTICHATGSLSKTFTNNTFMFNNTATSNENKVGDITKKYIEENREILKQQIKEAKKEEYEPS